MLSSSSATAASDLRVEPTDIVLDEVERMLRTQLDRTTLVRKRRSLGARTDRDTWVRIERRRFEKIGNQGWNGTECAALLDGIAMPQWRRGAAWRQRDEPVMWRAAETDLLPDSPVGNSVLVAAPLLPETWWQALNRSLDALSVQSTSRVATPDTITITQGGVAEAIHRFLPDGVDNEVRQWQPAHADLNWANMTGPEFSLFVCAKILAPDAHAEDPRLEPARRMAEQVVADLQRA